MKPQILVMAGSGIGNRCRVVLGAARVAERLGREVAIRWESKLWWCTKDVSIGFDWPGTWSDYFAHPLTINMELPSARPPDDNSNIVTPSDEPVIVVAGWRIPRFAEDPDSQGLGVGMDPRAYAFFQDLCQYMHYIWPAQQWEERANQFCQEHALDNGRWLSLHARAHHPDASPEKRQRAINYSIEQVRTGQYDGVVLIADQRPTHDYAYAQLQQAGIKTVYYPKHFDISADLASGATLVELLLFAKSAEIVANDFSTYSQLGWLYSRMRARFTQLA